MSIDPVQLLIGAAAAGAIAFVAWRAGSLAPSGAWGTLLLGTVVFGVGGVAWSVPLITFFVLGSLLSRLGAKRSEKRELQDLFEKGSRRDAGQVFANGGIAGMIVLLWAVWPRPELFIAYLGALAAAAADTWGTEIGVLGRGRVLSLRTLRPVPAGTSGGISLLGTAGAAAGALSVALAGAFSTPNPAAAIAVVVAAGMVGMLADSLIGATAQAAYRCDICGADTERVRHCDRLTTLRAGHRRVTNDAVNIACCLAGAIVGYLLALFS